MACARSTTCSLLKILETWLRTVFALRTRRAAISALLHSCAIRVSTSRSRSVNSGKGGSDAGHQPPGDVRLIRSLEQIATRSSPHSCEHRLVVLEHGEHEDPDMGAG